MYLFKPFSGRVSALFRVAPPVILEKRVKEISLDTLKSVMERCDTIMEQRQLFLDENLDIVSLSGIVATNRSYMSKAINVEKGMTFRDYLNLLRVNYAKKKLDEIIEVGIWISIEDLAVSCGFSCSRNMNKYFYKFYGITPLVYRGVAMVNMQVAEV